jgi:hypothetical protein
MKKYSTSCGYFFKYFITEASEHAPTEKAPGGDLSPLGLFRPESSVFMKANKGGAYRGEWEMI